MRKFLVPEEAEDFMLDAIKGAGGFNTLLGVGDESIFSMPDPRFNSHDRIYWVADPAQNPDLWEKGVIRGSFRLPSKDGDGWGHLYHINLDADSPSVDRIRCVVAWEHELAPHVVAHFPCEHPPQEELVINLEVSMESLMSLLTMESPLE